MIPTGSTGFGLKIEIFDISYPGHEMEVNTIGTPI